MNYGKQEETWKGKGLLKAAFLAVLIGAALTGCSRKVLASAPLVETVERHDTVTRYERHDSIVYQLVETRDSVSHIERHDTVINEYWHWVRDRRYETVLKSEIDSLRKVMADIKPEPVEVPVYVEKPLKAWQKTLMAVGLLALALLVLKIVLYIKK